MRLQRLWQLKLYSAELHDITNVNTVKARLGSLTSVDPCLLQPLMCRWRQRLGGHVCVYWIETSIKGIAASHRANKISQSSIFSPLHQEGKAQFDCVGHHSILEHSRSP
jgi:hypothetical protein